MCRWAVSQAAPLRSVVVDNGISLYEYEPPIPAAGEASGGFMANCKVGGVVQPGSQQQWMTRNSAMGKWGGGVWNMVFVGSTGAPPSHCSDKGSPPIVAVDKTPTIAEKPFISINASGKFQLNVPPAKADSVGPDFATKPVAVPFEQVYVTKTTDAAADINAKLAAGLHVVVSPGIYHLDAPLHLATSGQVLLGLGFATLVSAAATPVVTVADGVDNVRVAGLLLQAGAPVKLQSRTSPGGGEGAVATAPALLQWGTAAGKYAGKAALPGVISDVFARVGGPDGTAAAPVAADAMMIIYSGNVIADNMWLWRADHAAGGPVTYDSNACSNALVVEGDDVTIYGLASEHTEKDIVVWKGERGRTYFFQSELPYGVTQQEFGDPGYAGYRVDAAVTVHNAWGTGVYCFFNKFPVVVQSGIVCPPALVSSFVQPLTVWLNGQNGSAIKHIINDQGAAVEGPPTAVAYKCP